MGAWKKNGKLPWQAQAYLSEAKLQALSMEHMRIYQSFRETNHVTDKLTNLNGNGRDDPFDNKNTQPRDILGTIQMDQLSWFIRNEL